MSTTQPRILDLFCCQGGAAAGYAAAGFEVVGVDISPQPRYPFVFIGADALDVLVDQSFLSSFDAIHASPPCQAYSNAQRIQQREHPDLIGPVREALQRIGLPWVIENVEGAPLRQPVMLCGAMFGLQTYRHRLFEASFPIEVPEHPEHAAPLRKMGRPRRPGEFAHYVGNFSGVQDARNDLDVPWMDRDGIRESIPPAYSRYIGEQLLESLGRQLLPKGQGFPMGNTLDMNKIRDDHQARTLRLIDAFNAERPAVSEGLHVAIAAALTELATIWREEAQRLSDLPSPKPKGWKGTMDSYRDCATRVSGIAVAMEKYGLPGDATPKGDHATDVQTSTESRALEVGAAQASGDNPDPKDPSSTAPPTTPISAGAANGATTGPVHPSELPDLAGDFLRDLGRAPNAGDWTKGIQGPVKVTHDSPSGLLIIDDLFGAHLGKLEEETLEQAAASIIKQVRTAEEIDAGQVKVLKQGTPLDTTPGEGQPTMTIQFKDDPANLMPIVIASTPDNMFALGIDPASLTVGTADAPPAWASAPPATVYELTDDPAGWLPSPDHSSVSQANLAGECQMKWWLEKRRGAGGRPSWALVGGKAFHECVRVLETYDWSNIKPVSELWNTAFAEAIEQTQRENLDWPQDTWHASNKGKEGMSWWNLDGPEMVHRYLAWRNDFRNQGWELLKTIDGRVVLELEFLMFLGGGPVKGFIDQAWYHPIKNVIVIVDLKSGSSTPADFFQQATYRHAIAPLIGVVPSYWAGAFYDARKGLLGAPVDLDVRHSRYEVELRLSGPRRIDAAGLYMPNVNTGYGGCNSCSLKRSCPVGSRIGKGEISL